MLAISASQLVMSPDSHARELLSHLAQWSVRVIKLILKVPGNMKHQPNVEAYV